MGSRLLYDGCLSTAHWWEQDWIWTGVSLVPPHIRIVPPSFGWLVQGWWIVWPCSFPSGTDQGQLLGRKLGRHEPRLGHLSEGYDVRDTRTPMSLGHITDDTSQNASMYLRTQTGLKCYFFLPGIPTEMTQLYIACHVVLIHVMACLWSSVCTWPEASLQTLGHQEAVVWHPRHPGEGQ